MVVAAAARCCGCSGCGNGAPETERASRSVLGLLQAHLIELIKCERAGAGGGGCFGTRHKRKHARRGYAGNRVLHARTAHLQ